MSQCLLRRLTYGIQSPHHLVLRCYIFIGVIATVGCCVIYSDILPSGIFTTINHRFRQPWTHSHNFPILLWMGEILCCRHDRNLSKTIQKLIKKKKERNTHPRDSGLSDKTPGICIKCCAKSMNIRPFANLIISLHHVDDACRCHCSQYTRTRNQCTSTWITHSTMDDVVTRAATTRFPLCVESRAHHITIIREKKSKRKEKTKYSTDPSIQIALHKWRKCVLFALFSHF